RFFFFQAEDGIRDSSVTGVQTCALPIFDISWLDCNVPNESARCNQPVTSADVILRIGAAHETSGHQFTSMGFSLVNLSDGKAPRSEERRVGKEGSARSAR